jgi:prepilin-type N-terminal cleavage/methylation domain-containing protein
MQLAGQRARRMDGGFTLIELLLTIVIVGVITLPLGNLVIEYFQNSTKAAARLNESHDAQIAAAYFAQDVGSIGRRNQSSQTLVQSVWTGTTTPAPPYVCGSNTTPVLLLAWDQFTGPGTTPTTIEVSYITQTVGTETRLVRLRCSGTSAVDSSAVLAHDIDPGAAPAVVCSGGGSASCTDYPSVPTTIKLVLSINDRFDRGAAYSLTLTGQRRQTS